MVYYNKIALIQQIWYVHVFSWSLICSPNVRKKMQEDVSKDISKDISEKTVQNKCQKRCQKICQKNDSRYVRIYMSETMSEDLSTISEDRSGHLSLSIYIYMYISSECMSGQRNGQEICQDIRQDVVTYCGWKKSCTTLDGWNPINNGIIHLSTGAGFLPSTVCQHWKFVTGWWHKARRNSPRRLLGGWRASAMQTLGTWCTRRWCPRSLAKLVYHCQNLSLW